MPFESNIFMVVMGVLAVLGIVATVVYYFFRFGFRTEYDRDIEAKPKLDEVPAAPTPPKIPSQPKSLEQALSKTKASLFGRIREAIAGRQLGAGEREALEEILYTSDLGPKTVQRLLDGVDSRLEGGNKGDIEQVRTALRDEMLEIFSTIKTFDAESVESEFNHFSGSSRPQVWMIVGVNGAGKTTTIGKLAHVVSKAGKKVLIAAGDTFRAAAGEQLKVWSDRAQVEIFHPENTTDPSAVAYAAVEKARQNGFDLVIVDTAGRLHTQSHLMDELKKMKRVIQKLEAGGPHEVLLVLDANSGQNALIQAQQFHEALGVTGVILTKLDGSAKGGVAVGLASEHQLPIRLIGVGEGLEDLRPFKAREFVDSII